MKKSAGNVVQLPSASFEQTLSQPARGITWRQIEQHAELFEIAISAIEGYVTSHRAAGFHPDMMRFWRFHIATFQRHALQLRQALNARSQVNEPPAASPPPTREPWFGDADLARIKSLLARLPRGEWHRVRQDLIALVQGQLGPLQPEPAVRELRSKELAFVHAMIENPEFFTAP